MLDILNKYLDDSPSKCGMGMWIDTLSEEEQEAFALIKEKNQQIKLATLFKEISVQYDLQFKLTAFRSHLRGYCTCQKS
jgi:hypothetical protein